MYLVRLVGNPRRHMTCGHIFGGRQAVGLLVVKENMGAEPLQNRLLAQASEEEGLVHRYPPGAQGLDGPLVGWGLAGGDQGGADGAQILGPVRSLQAI